MTEGAVVVVSADAAADSASLGGKGAGLARLAACPAPVPPAFVVTAEGYRRAVPAEVRAEVARRIDALAPEAAGEALEAEAAALRTLIVEATEGHALTDEVRAAHDELARRTGDEELAVAVRSSSVAEDAADRSFAGEHDTYLWVRGADEVDRRLRECWASLVTGRAVAYRRDAAAAAGTAADRGEDLAMAVVVQQMVPARSAGVLMTLNPVNGDRSKTMIEAVWGLGEPLVSGAVTPDRFLVDKVTGEIRKREIAAKETEAVRDPATGRGIAVVEVAGERRTEPSLQDDEIAELLRLGRAVEKEAGVPQDIEFAITADDAPPDNVRLLQARPETVWANKRSHSVAKGKSALDSVLATLTKPGR
jgi:pyruvate,water dikinase